MHRLLRTPLYDWHIAQKARMVEFGGWEMPVQYSSVVQEHETTRNAVGLTDVSHMGRLIVEGKDASRFLDSVLTRNVAGIQPGQIRYSLLTNEQGGVVDDLLVGLIRQSETGQFYYYLVVNASNRVKDVAFLKKYLAKFLKDEAEHGVYLTDVSVDRGMLALQGPKAADLLQPLVNMDLSMLKYYNGTETTFAFGNRWGLITRTGYTGEDGFEIVVDSFFIEQFADQLLEAGKDLGIRPVGLGARDTLRLEASMPLYGHEMNEEINPFEARLDYALYLDGPDFPGRNALIDLKDKPLQKIRIGFEMLDKRPAREGCDILIGDQKVGWVSSGTFAPALQKPVGMGFVPPEFSKPGQALFIDVRGKVVPAVVASMPFYSRKK